MPGWSWPRPEPGSICIARSALRIASRYAPRSRGVGESAGSTAAAAGRNPSARRNAVYASPSASSPDERPPAPHALRRVRDPSAGHAAPPRAIQLPRILSRGGRGRPVSGADAAPGLTPTTFSRRALRAVPGGRGGPGLSGLQSSGRSCGPGALAAQRVRFRPPARTACPPPFARVTGCVDETLGGGGRGMHT